MERLDKIIASQGKYSRNEVRKLAAAGLVTVDGQKVSKPDIKVDPSLSQIMVAGELVSGQKHVYLLLNKPRGYTSTIEGNRMNTILDLVPLEFLREGLNAAGRLHRDMEGLMLLTTDGVLMHNIVSPGRHVKKIYEITLDSPVTDNMVKRFSEGIQLSDGLTLCVRITDIQGEHCRATTLDGRYFQIRQMFEKCGTTPLSMRRIQIGDLFMPPDLEPGECRPCTAEEICLLQKRSKELKP